jgi:hypothetical protein
LLLGAFALVIVVGLLMLLVAGYKWNKDQGEQAAKDSQRQDYALCIIQNENRATTRRVATFLYSDISNELRFNPPASPRLRDAKESQLKGLEAVLEAQRPIACSTYVRPDLPPDQGVTSTQEGAP